MAHGGHHSREQHGHHIIPSKTLVAVFGTLVLLTIITVASAQLDLGALNVPIALLLATTKTVLVVSFFMALKYDNRVNTMVFFVGVIFVAVFVVFTLFDTAFRGDLDNVDPETISDRARIEEMQRLRDPGVGPAASPQLEEDGVEETTPEEGPSSDGEPGAQ